MAGGGLPSAFALHGNAPNPFQPKTDIRFDLPRSGHVVLEIFGVDGRRVRTLADGPMDAGRKSVSWDGRDSAGHPLGSWIYFYRLQAGENKAVRKMTLIR